MDSRDKPASAFLGTRAIFHTCTKRRAFSLPRERCLHGGLAFVSLSLAAVAAATAAAATTTAKAAAKAAARKPEETNMLVCLEYF
jgi:topoisomerase IA-like protein